MKMLMKPSPYGTIKVMRLFFDKMFNPHCATLTHMIFHFLSIDIIGAEHLLPALSLPKKTYTEYMAERWYKMHITFNALKEICSGSGDRVLLTDQQFISEVLTPILSVLDRAVSSAIAECNDKKMDSARK